MAAPPAMSGGRRPAIPLAALLAAWLGITWPLWLNAYLSPPDSASYFAVARTLVHGGDLDFHDDYAALHFERYFFYVTATGRLSNDWPAGTGLVWLPAHLAARGAVAVAGAAGLGDDPRFAPTGTAPIALFLTSLWVALLGGVGLYLAARMAVRQGGVGRGAAIGAVIVVLLGTPVGFYYYAYAMMSHVVSLAAVAVLLSGWAATRGGERSWGTWALLGIAAGVMVAVRPQDVAFLAVFLVEFAFDVRARRAWRSWVRGVATGAAPAALLAFSPQMMIWGALYGHPLQLPKIEEMHWLAPRLGEMLFSDYHGLLSWSPVLVFVPAGLAILWRRDRVLAAGLAVAVAAQVYLNAANEIWWAGGSFGNRRFVSCGLPMIVALAALFGAPSPGRGRRLLLLAVGLATAWNFALFAAERGGRLTLDHYVRWDLPFVRNTLAMLLPQRALPALWGDFAGFGVGLRAACVGGALAFAGALALFARRGGWAAAVALAAWRARLGRGAVVVACATFALVVPAWVGIAAWRTVQTPPRSYDATFARRNLSLWNGYYEYGFFLWNRGRIAEAIDAYETAIGLIPHHAQPHRALATIHLLELRRPEEALAHAGRALDLMPVYPVALETFAAAAAQLVEREPHRLPELVDALAARMEAAGEHEEARRLRGAYGRAGVNGAPPPSTAAP